MVEVTRSGATHLGELDIALHTSLPHPHRANIRAHGIDVFWLADIRFLVSQRKVENIVVWLKAEIKKNVY